MKVLIYGGSFDPVHKGHCSLLKAATAQLQPDKIHLFTAYCSPYKEKSARPFEVRREMACAALSGISPNIIFDDFELEQARVVYTYETVERVKKLYPNAQIYLLVGADCLNSMENWKNSPYIFENCTIIAGKRKGFCTEKKNFPYIMMEGNFPLMSSTTLRLAILSNGIVPNDLPHCTAAAIEQNCMYGLHLHKWLSQNLKPNRYLHVKLVAQAATELAKFYNADREKAALAAILHDCAKCMTNGELIKYCFEHNLAVEDFDDICKYSPSLLHAEVSADMAEHKFGVKDADVLNAIKNHTLGRLDMSLLEKILFIADMASKDRARKDAKKVFACALQSLEAGMRAAMSVKLAFTVETQKWLAPRGIRLWNKTISADN